MNMDVCIMWIQRPRLNFSKKKILSYYNIIIINRMDHGHHLYAPVENRPLVPVHNYL
jgi:hypothetical protein